MSSENDSTESHSRFSVRHSHLSLIMLAITVSSIAALAVVATMNKADALSTVALALAVLAFSAQLVVTMSQSQASAAQIRDTASINAETRSVLADLQAQGSALVSMQSGQFERLLNKVLSPDNIGAALTKSTDDESGGADDGTTKVDPVAFANELRSLFEANAREDRPLNGSYNATRISGEKDGVRAVEDFQNLSPEARQILVDVAASRRSGRRVFLRDGSRNERVFDELAQAGFIKIGTVDEDGRKQVTLPRWGALIKELLDPNNPVLWARGLRKKLDVMTREDPTGSEPTTL